MLQRFSRQAAPPQSPCCSSKVSETSSVKTRLRRWPALCESGKENDKHRKFPCVAVPQYRSRGEQIRRGNRSDAAHAAKQAAAPVRKRPTQNPSMPSQRDGPRPAGRAPRQFAFACRRSASADRLAPPHHAAAIRSAQKRILSNAGPPFQSGKEDFEHRYSHALRFARGERSDAVPPRSRQKKKQTKSKERLRGFKILPCRANGTAPVRQDGRRRNPHPPAVGAPSSQPRAAIR